MTDEDIVVAKLKGHNFLIKFNDGEEFTDESPDLFSDSEQWLMDVEKFINGSNEVEYCPMPGIAISRKAIKYVRQL